MKRFFKAIWRNRPSKSFLVVLTPYAGALVLDALCFLGVFPGTGYAVGVSTGISIGAIWMWLAALWYMPRHYAKFYGRNWREDALLGRITRERFEEFEKELEVEVEGRQN